MEGGSSWLRGAWERDLEDSLSCNGKSATGPDRTVTELVLSCPGELGAVCVRAELSLAINGGNMGNATSRQKCPMRPIAQFKTPWLPCDLLFRCGGQFDLGGWVGGMYVLGWDGMCGDAMRCVARRGAVL